MQLYKAISTQDIDAIQSQIKKGIDVNVIDEKDGKTPLTKAIYLENIEIVRILLQAGANINQIDDWEKTPLEIAASLGNLKMVEFLQKLGANINCGSLNEAVSCHHLNVVKFLIDAGADVNLRNESGLTSLMTAARLGFLEICQLLVSAGADVHIADEDYRTALSIAIEAGEKDIVEYLLPFYDSDEPQRSEYVEEALPRAIIRKQRRENKFTSSFIKAVNLSEIDFVRTAIESGVNINAFSEGGKTALHIATERGNVEMIQLLIQAGANYEIKDEVFGWTPLMQAANSCQYEALKTLINLGANVNATAEKDSRTALMLAVSSYSEFDLPFDYPIPYKKQWLKIIQMLIEMGVNLDAKDRWGNTALMIAKAKKASNIVNMLT